MLEEFKPGASCKLTTTAIKLISLRYWHQSQVNNWQDWFTCPITEAKPDSRSGMLISRCKDLSHFPLLYTWCSASHESFKMRTLKKDKKRKKESSYQETNKWIKPDSKIIQILCDPMNTNPRGSSVHGLLQARILEPFPSPGDFPKPGIKPRSPTLQVDSLLPEPLGKPHSTYQTRTLP